ncbi:YbaY family lipoprotein [Vibrio panuliri]|uniref:Lipo-like protein n=1 Tax=Vibrio panuliri TaxID=1381081 RepID=A0ABX3F801_9VIBR|nr:YbaY family lipoprotein [Vibrio panuliri]KAB1454028.1 lipo-like protein [Vibrio panuliri]OLQ84441.1 lipo-like protein [Vibrio panuliri]
MKKALMLMASVVFGATLIGCQSEPTSQVQMQQSVTGTVAYRERILLPDNAVVTVRLQDISLADAPAKLVAEQVMETEGKQVPFAFTLDYDADTILPGHTYAVSARIEVNGKLHFTTDTVYPVINDEAKTQHRDLMLVGVGR